MSSTKLKFILITVLALMLAVAAGYILKTSNGLSRGQQIGWGLILTAGSLTFVRGLRYLGRH